jgi:hypothetical protein
VTKKVHGDAGNVNNDDIIEWERTTLARIHSSYKPENIFNIDEFGLLYRMRPNSTQTFKKTPKSALALGKASKKRITVLIGASATGEKLPLSIIGKSERPRCFGKLRVLPCDYNHNRRAWMTRQIWRTIIEKLERKMRREKRKIAVIVDNVTQKAPAGTIQTRRTILPSACHNFKDTAYGCGCATLFPCLNLYLTQE